MEVKGRRRLFQRFLSVSILPQLLFLSLLVFQVESSTLDLNFIGKFFEPDAGRYRSLPINPVTWHTKRVPEILKIWGLSGEEHTITTEDGYILSLFRIKPRGSNPTSGRSSMLRTNQMPRRNWSRMNNRTMPASRGNELRPPVLFLHGAVVCPETWLFRGKEDLAIILEEEGYDVWLAAYRGSIHGMRHVNMTSQDEKFWDFSFHEFGKYDTPAMIDHIIKVTGSPKVATIAHSMGNAVVMAMMAMRPEYSDKVSLFVGLAPYAVVRMADTLVNNHVIPNLVPFLSYTILRHAMGPYKIGPLVAICAYIPAACTTFLGHTQGIDENNMDLNAFVLLTAYAPAGSSVKVLRHLFDLSTGKFRQFDFGPQGNLERYNSTEAPAYDLSNFRAPASLYFGDKDKRVSITWMDEQVKALPNVVQARSIESYTHVDFLIAKDTREMLYNPILEDLRRYTRNQT